MKFYIHLLFIVYLKYSIQSSAIFSIQETLTVLCQPFPLVSTINDSSLQCARLRTDENVPTSIFNLYTPTQLTLFIIINPPLSTGSYVDITINLSQSLDRPSSINDINFSLLVARSNFTVNNQTAIVYTPYEIPIFRWQSTTEDTYDLINIIGIEDQLYESDTSLCQWSTNQWNRVFNTNISNHVPYVYFIKTTNLQLSFIVINTSNETSLLPPLPPYLNILYCIPYKLGVTEIVLIVCFGVLFLAGVVIYSIYHYFKGGPDNRTRHFDGYYHRHHQDSLTGNHSTNGRRHSSASVVTTAERPSEDN